MATCNLFDEDVVCQFSPSKGYIFGVVLENSEFISSDEDEDDVNDMDDERVKKGFVRVAWHPDGKEMVVDENKVILVDRSIMPGDVIRRMVNGKDSQQGYVQDIEVTCHVKILGTDKYIYNINSRDLLPITEFDTNPGEVTLDSWIGRIECIHRNVTIRMPDGARCVIKEDDLCDFHNIEDKRSRHSVFWNSSVYPQMKFKGQLSDLQDAEWLHSTMIHNPRNVDNKKHSSVLFIVEKVETESVEVHWLCRGYSQVEDPQFRIEAPPNVITGDDLKRLIQLDWFVNCSVQAGDTQFYIIKPGDKLETVSPCECVVPESVSKLGEEQAAVFKKKSKDKAEEDGERDKVVNGENHEDDGDDEYEDVDDSTDDSDTDSNHSGSSRGSSAGNKRKGRRKASFQLKMMRKNKGRPPKMKFNLPERSLEAGEMIPVEIYYTISKANIMWQDGTVEDGVLSSDLYPIHHLDELEFFPGDFVVDAKDTQACSTYGVVASCDHEARTCHIQWVKPYDLGKTKEPSVLSELHEVSVYDIKDHPNYKFRPAHSVIRVGGFEDTEQQLSAVGQVYRLSPEGSLQIKWIHGEISKCYPQELYIVSDELSEFGDSDHSSSSSESDSDRSYDNSSWETESEEEVDTEEGPNSEASNKSKKKWVLTSGEKKELLMKVSAVYLALADQGEMLEKPIAVMQVSSCHQMILKFYKSCKGIDRLLRTKYFEDEELVEWISDLQKVEREEKTKKIAKHLKQLYSTYNQGLIKMKMSQSDSMDLDMDLDDLSNLSNISTPDEFSFSGDVKADAIADNPFSLAVSAQKETNSVSDINPGVKSNCDTKAMNEMCSSDSNSNNHQPLQTSEGHVKDIGENNEAVDIKHDSSACDKSLVDLKSPAAEEDESLSEYKMLLEKKLSTYLKIYHRLNKIIKSKVQEDIERRCLEDDDETNKPVEQSSSENSVKEETAGATENSKDSSPEAVKESRASDDHDLMEMVCNQHQSQKAERKKANSPVNAEDSRIAVEELGSPLSVTGFQCYGELPLGHHYYSNTHIPNNLPSFASAVQKELKLLQTSLPPGIFVKGFDDRMDVFSAMFVGPSHTPYEDGLFVFDLQLSTDYPNSPPRFHYISYCTERLNPNLYEDGKVCISLLGTWTGKGNELWSKKSNLLQIFVSVQGLILVKEPYYNEAGYEKQKGSQQAYENSRMYNEMAILKLVQSMTAMAARPPIVFEAEVKEHLLKNGPRMIKRLRDWISMSGHTFAGSEKAKSQDGASTSGVVGGQTISNGTQESNSTVKPSMDDDKSSSVDPPTSKTICDRQVVCGAANNPTPGEAMHSGDSETCSKPDFPLFPASKGFCLSLQKNLEKFESILQTLQPQ